MTTHNNVAPIIIKRKKIIVSGGHHGGAWKLAYADFVTASLTNDLLRQIQNKLTATDLVSVSHWVGKQVEIPNNVGFFGEDAEIRATLPADATHGKVEVLSASGAVIASLPIHPGDQSVTWDGRKTTGEMVSYGIYSAHIIPYDRETELETGSVYSYHSVQEVSLEDGKTVLGLADGNYVYSDMVTALKI